MHMHLKILIIVMLVSCQPKNNMNNQTFKAERVSRTANITVSGGIEKVFPLFGAFEERKWAEGWNPTLVYPSEEVMEEGTTFTTKASGKLEKEFLWRVSKYEPEQFMVQYLVSTANRYWTITVKCADTPEHNTTAEITYAYTGLNPLGNTLNAEALNNMYSANLKDWEEAINYFLANGKMLVQH
jgi:hypothetical protein